MKYFTVLKMSLLAPGSLGGFAAVSARLGAIHHRQADPLRAIILARTHPLLLR